MKSEELSDSISIDGMSKDDAIVYLMRCYGEEIKRLVYTFVKNWQQAEDITQDVYISLYTKLDTFRGESAVRSWIYTIAINKSKDFLKSWSYRKLAFTDKFTTNQKESAHSAEDGVIASSEDQLLYQAVLSLPLKYREVILLHYYKEFSVGEIGELLSMNESTVKTRLSRARRVLQDSYIELGGER
ncbi:sigma-70 family RNA polymerase sigma factor [Fictibacillus sp. 23RED33]|uniref:sigma-70 family RNA polymerase sigma factor n=1 Tax=Fictibacillus sp. 23RED33 TaxID=2745879 RepID=UPI0018CEDB6D|nr:sigma-70 family RNA polymerase sigma factor [Fictibacillus sp. 23RED33]